MKRISAFCIAAALALSLFACGAGGTAVTPSPEAPEPAVTPGRTDSPPLEAAGAAPAEEAPPLRVEITRDEDTVTDDSGSLVLFRYGADRARVALSGAPGAEERINAALDEAYRLFEEGDPNADGGGGRDYFENAARAEYADRGSENADWYLPYEYSRSLDVKRGDGRVLSLTCLGYTYSGGVHGYAGLDAVNFDLATGEILRLEDLADDPEEFLRQCADRLWEISRGGKYTDLALDGYFPGYEEDLPGLLRDGNWYFDSQGLTVIANPYEIAPYASGRIEFTLPYDWLQWRIREEYLPGETGGSGALSGEITDTVPGADITLDDGTNGQGACVLFKAEGTAKEVRLTRVASYERENGFGFYDDGTLWYASAMADGETLLVRAWFGDVVPTLKIGWTNARGSREEYLLFQSGKDGSLVMMRDAAPALPLDILRSLPFEYDLDGDGETEIIDMEIAQSDGQSHGVLTVNGLPAEDTYATDAAATGLLLADLDGDGRTEILFSGDLGSDDCVTCAWRGDTLALIPFTGETRRGRDGAEITSLADGTAAISGYTLYLESWTHQLGTYLSERAYEYSGGVIKPCPDTKDGFDGWHYLKNRNRLTMTKDLPVTWENGEESMLQPGTELLLRGTEGDRAHFMTSDGRRGWIDLVLSRSEDYSGWTVEGVPENEFFERLPYAG